MLSIKPKLTICSPLVALTQNRMMPVAEIEPLNVVPAGNANCNCDAELTVNVGTVVANDGRANNEVNRRTIDTAEIANLVFSIVPTRRMLSEMKMGL